MENFTPADGRWITKDSTIDLWKYTSFDLPEKYYIICSIYPPERTPSPICYSVGSFFASSLGNANNAKEMFLKDIGSKFNGAISADLYSRRLIINPNGKLTIKNKYINDEKFGKSFRCDNPQLLKKLFQQIKKFTRSC